MNYIKKILIIALLPMLLFLSCNPEDLAKISLVVKDGSSTYLNTMSVPFPGTPSTGSPITHSFELENVGEQRLTFINNPYVEFQGQYIELDAGGTANDDSFFYQSHIPTDYLDPGDTTTFLAEFVHVSGKPGEAYATLMVETTDADGNPVNFQYEFYGTSTC